MKRIYQAPSPHSNTVFTMLLEKYYYENTTKVFELMSTIV